MNTVQFVPLLGMLGTQHMPVTFRDFGAKFSIFNFQFAIPFIKNSNDNGTPSANTMKPAVGGAEHFLLSKYPNLPAKDAAETLLHVSYR